jgi:hypothetical protein
LSKGANDLHYTFNNIFTSADGLQLPQNYTDLDYNMAPNADFKQVPISDGEFENVVAEVEIKNALAPDHGSGYDQVMNNIG